METKWVCSVCGYIYEGAEPPAECPVCHAPASAFKKLEGEQTLAAEHEYGIYAKTVKDNEAISDEDKKFILDQLKANFNGRVLRGGHVPVLGSHRASRGLPEIGLYWEKGRPSKRRSTPRSSQNCSAKSSSQHEGLDEREPRMAR